MEQENEYWSLLISTQRAFYPGFTDQLLRQIGPRQEEGRAAVINFQDGANPSVQQFEKSRALRSYLNSPSSRSPGGPVIRRMFVLEGLPRKFIQVLGSKLRVPPSLFAARWAGPGRYLGNLLKRTPRHYDNRSCFTLIAPKIHQARIEGKASDNEDPVYYMESSVIRQLSCITLFGDITGPLSSFEHLSFWSLCEGQSWEGKSISIFVNVLTQFS